jgi:hypothetical protein
VHASLIVLAGGSIGSTALLLRSPISRGIRHLGRDFTCHPAQILVAEHEHEITNDVGHPKSFYLDFAERDGYVLETCMYFPFVTAKNLTGFGAEHSRFLRAFPRLQMILALACDKAAPANRITVDRDGKPVVHYRCTRLTIESLVKATRMATQVFFAAGAVAVHAPTAHPSLIERREIASIDERIQARHFPRGRTSISAAHLMGGCGMGHPNDSVTDGWGRVHGIPWLRVADSSLFPDSVEINPYVTVMALADRVAEKIKLEAAILFDAYRRDGVVTA